MKNLTLTLQYWKESNWFVGYLVEVPGVMSQGQTLAELEANIEDAYQLVLSERRARISHPPSRSKSIPIQVAA